jgi:predicted lipoprotein with Yx(FWY)xxD motif
MLRDALRTSRLAVTVLALLLALGACAADPVDDSEEAASDTADPAGVGLASQAPPAAPSAAPSITAGTMVTTGSAEPYGAVLTDGTGMTLYVFFEDSGGRSMCYDACAQNWPPLLTTAEPVAAGEIDGGLLGTLERDDGALQVTYDGHPLYRYTGDSEPGDLRGLGSGNVWYPVTPDGPPVEAVTGASGPAGPEFMAGPGPTKHVQEPRQGLGARY